MVEAATRMEMCVSTPEPLQNQQQQAETATGTRDVYRIQRPCLSLGKNNYLHLPIGCRQ